MSLFGAMNTAVSGLTAQSTAFGNISDNVANSQTVGYKRVDTSFIDYLTTSTCRERRPGCRGRHDPTMSTTSRAPSPRPTIRSALRSPARGSSRSRHRPATANNLPTFSPQQYYTRAGDFQMDKNGYLVN